MADDEQYIGIFLEADLDLGKSKTNITKTLKGIMDHAEKSLQGKKLNLIDETHLGRIMDVANTLKGLDGTNLKAQGDSLETFVTGVTNLGEAAASHHQAIDSLATAIDNLEASSAKIAVVGNTLETLSNRITGSLAVIARLNTEGNFDTFLAHINGIKTTKITELSGAIGDLGTAINGIDSEKVLGIAGALEKVAALNSTQNAVNFLDAVGRNAHSLNLASDAISGLATNMRSISEIKENTHDPFLQYVETIRIALSECRTIKHELETPINIATNRNNSASAVSSTILKDEKGRFTSIANENKKRSQSADVRKYSDSSNEHRDSITASPFDSFYSSISKLGKVIDHVTDNISRKVEGGINNRNNNRDITTNAPIVTQIKSSGPVRIEAVAQATNPKTPQIVGDVQKGTSPAFTGAAPTHQTTVIVAPHQNTGTLETLVAVRKAETAPGVANGSREVKTSPLPLHTQELDGMLSKLSQIRNTNPNEKKSFHLDKLIESIAEFKENYTHPALRINSGSDTNSGIKHDIDRFVKLLGYGLNSAKHGVEQQERMGHIDSVNAAHVSNIVKDLENMHRNISQKVMQNSAIEFSHPKIASTVAYQNMGPAAMVAEHAIKIAKQVIGDKAGSQIIIETHPITGGRALGSYYDGVARINSMAIAKDIQHFHKEGTLQLGQNGMVDISSVTQNGSHLHKLAHEYAKVVVHESGHRALGGISESKAQDIFAFMRKELDLQVHPHDITVPESLRHSVTSNDKHLNNAMSNMLASGSYDPHNFSEEALVELYARVKMDKEFAHLKDLKSIKVMDHLMENGGKEDANLDRLLGVFSQPTPQKRGIFNRFRRDNEKRQSSDSVRYPGASVGGFEPEDSSLTDAEAGAQLLAQAMHGYDSHEDHTVFVPHAPTQRNQTQNRPPRNEGSGAHVGGHDNLTPVESTEPAPSPTAVFNNGGSHVRIAQSTTGGRNFNVFAQTNSAGEIRHSAGYVVTGHVDENGNPVDRHAETFADVHRLLRGAASKDLSLVVSPDAQRSGMPGHMSAAGTIDTRKFLSQTKGLADKPSFINNTQVAELGDTIRHLSDNATDILHQYMVLGDEIYVKTAEGANRIGNFKALKNILGREHNAKEKIKDARTAYHSVIEREIGGGALDNTTPDGHKLYADVAKPNKQGISNNLNDQNSFEHLLPEFANAGKRLGVVTHKGQQYLVDEGKGKVHEVIGNNLDGLMAALKRAVGNSHSEDQILRKLGESKDSRATQLYDERKIELAERAKVSRDTKKSLYDQLFALAKSSSMPHPVHGVEGNLSFVHHEGKLFALHENKEEAHEIIGGEEGILALVKKMIGGGGFGDAEARQKILASNEHGGNNLGAASIEMVDRAKQMAKDDAAALKAKEAKAREEARKEKKVSTYENSDTGLLHQALKSSITEQNTFQHPDISKGRMGKEMSYVTHAGRNFLVDEDGFMQVRDMAHAFEKIYKKHGKDSKSEAEMLESLKGDASLKGDFARARLLEISKKEEADNKAKAAKAQTAEDKLKSAAKKFKQFAESTTPAHEHPADVDGYIGLGMEGDQKVFIDSTKGASGEGVYIDRLANAFDMIANNPVFKGMHKDEIAKRLTGMGGLNADIAKDYHKRNEEQAQAEAKAKEEKAAALKLKLETATEGKKTTADHKFEDVVKTAAFKDKSFAHPNALTGGNVAVVKHEGEMYLVLEAQKKLVNLTKMADAVGVLAKAMGVSEEYAMKKLQSMGGNAAQVASARKVQLAGEEATRQNNAKVKTEGKESPAVKLFKDIQQLISDKVHRIEALTTEGGAFGYVQDGSKHYVLNHATGKAEEVDGLIGAYNAIRKTLSGFSEESVLKMLHQQGGVGSQIALERQRHLANESINDQAAASHKAREKALNTVLNKAGNEQKKTEAAAQRRAANPVLADFDNVTGTYGVTNHSDSLIENNTLALATSNDGKRSVVVDHNKQSVQEYTSLAEAYAILRRNKALSGLKEHAFNKKLRAAGLGHVVDAHLAEKTAAANTKASAAQLKKDEAAQKRLDENGQLAKYQRLSSGNVSHMSDNLNSGNTFGLVEEDGQKSILNKNAKRAIDYNTDLEGYHKLKNMAGFSGLEDATISAKMRATGFGHFVNAKEAHDLAVAKEKADNKAAAAFATATRLAKAKNDRLIAKSSFQEYAGVSVLGTKTHNTSYNELIYGTSIDLATRDGEQYILDNAAQTSTKVGSDLEAYKELHKRMGGKRVGNDIINKRLRDAGLGHLVDAKESKDADDARTKRDEIAAKQATKAANSARKKASDPNVQHFDRLMANVNASNTFTHPVTGGQMALVDDGTGKHFLLDLQKQKQTYVDSQLAAFNILRKTMGGNAATTDAALRAQGGAGLSLANAHAAHVATGVQTTRERNDALVAAARTQAGGFLQHPSDSAQRVAVVTHTDGTRWVVDTMTGQVKQVGNKQNAHDILAKHLIGSGDQGATVRADLETQASAGNGTAVSTLMAQEAKERRQEAAKEAQEIASSAKKKTAASANKTRQSALVQSAAGTQLVDDVFVQHNLAGFISGINSVNRDAHGNATKSESVHSSTDLFKAIQSQHASRTNTDATIRSGHIADMFTAVGATIQTDIDAAGNITRVIKDKFGSFFTVITKGVNTVVKAYGNDAAKVGAELHNQGANVAGFSADIQKGATEKAKQVREKAAKEAKDAAREKAYTDAVTSSAAAQVHFVNTATGEIHSIVKNAHGALTVQTVDHEKRTTSSVNATKDVIKSLLNSNDMSGIIHGTHHKGLYDLLDPHMGTQLLHTSDASGLGSAKVYEGVNGRTGKTEYNVATVDAAGNVLVQTFRRLGEAMQLLDSKGMELNAQQEREIMLLDRKKTSAANYIDAFGSHPQVMGNYKRRQLVNDKRHGMVYKDTGIMMDKDGNAYKVENYVQAERDAAGNLVKHSNKHAFREVDNKNIVESKFSQVDNISHGPLEKILGLNEAMRDGEKIHRSFAGSLKVLLGEIVKWGVGYGVVFGALEKVKEAIVGVTEAAIKFSSDKFKLKETIEDIKDINNLTNGGGSGKGGVAQGAEDKKTARERLSEAQGAMVEGHGSPTDAGAVYGSLMYGMRGKYGAAAPDEAMKLLPDVGGFSYVNSVDAKKTAGMVQTVASTYKMGTDQTKEYLSGVNYFHNKNVDMDALTDNLDKTAGVYQSNQFGAHLHAAIMGGGSMRMSGTEQKEASGVLAGLPEKIKDKGVRRDIYDKLKQHGTDLGKGFYEGSSSRALTLAMDAVSKNAEGLESKDAGVRMRAKATANILADKLGFGGNIALMNKSAKGMEEVAHDAGYKNLTEFNDNRGTVKPRSIKEDADKMAKGDAGKAWEAMMNRLSKIMMDISKHAEPGILAALHSVDETIIKVGKHTKDIEMAGKGLSAVFGIILGFITRIGEWASHRAEYLTDPKKAIGKDLTSIKNWATGEATVGSQEEAMQAQLESKEAKARAARKENGTYTEADKKTDEAIAIKSKEDAEEVTRKKKEKKEDDPGIMFRMGGHLADAAVPIATTLAVGGLGIKTARGLGGVWNQAGAEISHGNIWQKMWAAPKALIKTPFSTVVDHAAANTRAADLRAPAKKLAAEAKEAANLAKEAEAKALEEAATKAIPKPSVPKPPGSWMTDPHAAWPNAGAAVETAVEGAEVAQVAGGAKNAVQAEGKLAGVWNWLKEIGGMNVGTAFKASIDGLSNMKTGLMTFGSSTAKAMLSMVTGAATIGETFAAIKLAMIGMADASILLKVGLYGALAGAVLLAGAQIWKLLEAWKGKNDAEAQTGETNKSNSTTLDSQVSNRHSTIGDMMRTGKLKGADLEKAKIIDKGYVKVLGMLTAPLGKDQTEESRQSDAMDEMKKYDGMLKGQKWGHEVLEGAANEGTPGAAPKLGESGLVVGHPIKTAADVKALATYVNKRWGLKPGSNERPGDSGYHGKGLAYDLQMGIHNPHAKEMIDFLVSQGARVLPEAPGDRYGKSVSTGDHVHFDTGGKPGVVGNRAAQFGGKNGFGGGTTKPSGNIGGSVAGVPIRAIPQKYSTMVDRLASEGGIDPAILKTLMNIESGGVGFNPKARSSAGAIGLMQVMQSNAPGKDLTDPETNIKAGIKVFQEMHAQLKQMTHGKVNEDQLQRLSAAAYNMGIGRKGSAKYNAFAAGRIPGGGDGITTGLQYGNYFAGAVGKYRGGTDLSAPTSATTTKEDEEANLTFDQKAGRFGEYKASGEGAKSLLESLRTNSTISQAEKSRKFHGEVVPQMQAAYGGMKRMYDSMTPAAGDVASAKKKEDLGRQLQEYQAAMKGAEISIEKDSRELMIKEGQARISILESNLGIIMKRKEQMEVSSGKAYTATVLASEQESNILYTMNAQLEVALKAANLAHDDNEREKITMMLAQNRVKLAELELQRFKALVETVNEYFDAFRGGLHLQETWNKSRTKGYDLQERTVGTSDKAIQVTGNNISTLLSGAYKGKDFGAAFDKGNIGKMLAQMIEEANQKAEALVGTFREFGGVLQSSIDNIGVLAKTDFGKSVSSGFTALNTNMQALATYAETLSRFQLGSLERQRALNALVSTENALKMQAYGMMGKGIELHGRAQAVQMSNPFGGEGFALNESFLKNSIEKRGLAFEQSNILSHMGGTENIANAKAIRQSAIAGDVSSDLMGSAFNESAATGTQALKDSMPGAGMAKYTAATIELQAKLAHNNHVADIAKQIGQIHDNYITGGKRGFKGGDEKKLTGFIEELRQGHADPGIDAFKDPKGAGAKATKGGAEGVAVNNDESFKYTPEGVGATPESLMAKATQLTTEAKFSLTDDGSIKKVQEGMQETHAEITKMQKAAQDLNEIFDNQVRILENEKELLGLMVKTEQLHASNIQSGFDVKEQAGAAYENISKQYGNIVGESIGFNEQRDARIGSLGVKRELEKRRQGKLENSLNDPKLTQEQRDKIGADIDSSVLEQKKLTIQMQVEIANLDPITRQFMDIAKGFGDGLSDAVKSAAAEYFKYITPLEKQESEMGRMHMVERMQDEFMPASPGLQKMRALRDLSFDAQKEQREYRLTNDPAFRFQEEFKKKSAEIPGAIGTKIAGLGTDLLYGSIQTMLTGHGKDDSVEEIQKKSAEALIEAARNTDKEEAIVADRAKKVIELSKVATGGAANALLEAAHKLSEAADAIRAAAGGKPVPGTTDHPGPKDANNPNAKPGDISPNAATTVSNPDGSTSTTNPDGSVTTVGVGGDTSTVNTDGSTSYGDYVPAAATTADAASGAVAVANTGAAAGAPQASGTSVDPTKAIDGGMGLLGSAGIKLPTGVGDALGMVKTVGQLPGMFKNIAGFIADPAKAMNMSMGLQTVNGAAPTGMAALAAPAIAGVAGGVVGVVGTNTLANQFLTGGMGQNEKDARSNNGMMVGAGGALAGAAAGAAIGSIIPGVGTVIGAGVGGLIGGGAFTGIGRTLQTDEAKKADIIQKAKDDAMTDMMGQELEINRKMLDATVAQTRALQFQGQTFQSLGDFLKQDVHLLTSGADFGGKSYDQNIKGIAVSKDVGMTTSGMLGIGSTNNGMPSTPGGSTLAAGYSLQALDYKAGTTPAAESMKNMASAQTAMQNGGVALPGFEQTIQLRYNTPDAPELPAINHDVNLRYNGINGPSNSSIKNNGGDLSEPKARGVN